jgi:hypothetical protein
VPSCASSRRAPRKPAAETGGCGKRLPVRWRSAPPRWVEADEAPPGRQGGGGDGGSHGALLLDRRTPGSDRAAPQRGAGLPRSAPGSGTLPVLQNRKSVKSRLARLTSGDQNSPSPVSMRTPSGLSRARRSCRSVESSRSRTRRAGRSGRHPRNPSSGQPFAIGEDEDIRAGPPTGCRRPPVPRSTSSPSPPRSVSSPSPAQISSRPPDRTACCRHRCPTGGRHGRTLRRSRCRSGGRPSHRRPSRHRPRADGDALGDPA